VRGSRVRLTGPGIITLLVLAVFVVLALAGSGVLQIVGFAGAVLVAIALVGGVPMRGASGGRRLTSTERGRTIVEPDPEVLDEAPVDPAAWQRERARREGGDAGAAAEPEPVYNPFEGGGRR
jgi:hypothetical protein